MKSLLLAMIRFYQFAISPMFGQRCRFFPTCSEYAVEAIRKHGAARGLRLTIARLSRCHPWNPGGFDPVP